MSSTSNLFLRRAGIASMALASYGAIVYLTYDFMSATMKKNQQRHCHANTTTTTSAGNNTNAVTTATAAAANNSNNLQQQQQQQQIPSTSHVTDPNRHLTFHKIASVYDAQISSEENAMFLPLFRKCLLYFHAKGKVLEVGAGTGRNLNYYSFSNKNRGGGVDEVILTDISEEMLRQAREKVKQHKNKDRFKLFVADAKEMTMYYPEDSFDTVVDTFGLCSFDDPVQVLKELQRICKPGGKILLLEHGRSKSCGPLTNYLDKTAERHAKNWGCVYNRDLDSILKESGVMVETLHTWHFGTTYYVVCRPGTAAGSGCSGSGEL